MKPRLSIFRLTFIISAAVVLLSVLSCSGRKERAMPLLETVVTLSCGIFRIMDYL